jgi:hypothetical protein
MGLRALSTSVTLAVKRATAVIDASGGLERATDMADVARLVALA